MTDKQIKDVKLAVISIAAIELIINNIVITDGFGEHAKALDLAEKVSSFINHNYDEKSKTLTLILDEPGMSLLGPFYNAMPAMINAPSLQRHVKMLFNALENFQDYTIKFQSSD